MAMSGVAGCQADDPIEGPQDIWSFNGRVTQVIDTKGILGGHPPLGAGLTGSFQLPVGATDQDPSPNFGRFEEGDIYVLINGFGVNPSETFRLDTYNNSSGIGDAFRVAQSGPVTDLQTSAADVQAGGTTRIGIFLELEDPSANALQSTDPPDTFYMESWDLRRVWIHGYASNGNPQWYVLGTVDSILACQLVDCSRCSVSTETGGRPKPTSL